MLLLETGKIQSVTVTEKKKKTNTKKRPMQPFDQKSFTTKPFITATENQVFKFSIFIADLKRQLNQTCHPGLFYHPFPSHLGTEEGDDLDGPNGVGVISAFCHLDSGVP